MDDMVKELIEMDKRAQETVQQAEEKRDKMKIVIANEKEELRQGYLDRANGRVDKMKQAAANEYTEQSVKIDEGFRASAQAMEEVFEKNRGAWVKEITARCKQTGLSQ